MTRFMIALAVLLIGVAVSIILYEQVGIKCWPALIVTTLACLSVLYFKVHNR